MDTFLPYILERRLLAADLVDQNVDIIPLQETLNIKNAHVQTFITSSLTHANNIGAKRAFP